MSLVFKSDPVRGEVWKRILFEKMPELEFRIWPDVSAPLSVRYLVAWVPPDNVAEQFPNLEILFSVGAGVDQFDFSTLPANLPVVRMVESGIVDGMVEYVTMAVLSLHRNLIEYVADQKLSSYAPRRVWPAATRRVGILGLGMLGQACAARLATFGFQVAGWSRSPRSLPGIATYSSGQLFEFLGRTDILVCLLPLTAETRGFLNRDLFAGLAPGASLVQVGRGGQLDNDALLEALSNGQISAAVLDVTDPEPLPDDHPFWSHPKVVLTPHVGAMTQPETAVDALLDNLRRHADGEPLIGLVDRVRGY